MKCLVMDLIAPTTLPAKNSKTLFETLRAQ
jgi:hypothetical protein